MFIGFVFGFYRICSIILRVFGLFVVYCRLLICVRLMRRLDGFMLIGLIVLISCDVVLSFNRLC